MTPTNSPDKKTVLIVEDDNSIREILVEKFESEGFTVLDGANGQEGLEKFNSAKIDLILLDLYMPVMDGYTFLDKLRVLPTGKDMPVVVLSNLVDHDYVVSAFDKHVANYLLKTNTGLDGIVEKVKKVLNP